MRTPGAVPKQTDAKEKKKAEKDKTGEDPAKESANVMGTNVAFPKHILVFPLYAGRLLSAFLRDANERAQ